MQGNKVRLGLEGLDRIGDHAYFEDAEGLYMVKLNRESWKDMGKPLFVYLTVPMGHMAEDEDTPMEGA
jgi:hypothetical protein